MFANLQITCHCNRGREPCATEFRCKREQRFTGRVRPHSCAQCIPSVEEFNIHHCSSIGSGSPRFSTNKSEAYKNQTLDFGTSVVTFAQDLCTSSLIQNTSSLIFCEQFRIDGAGNRTFQLRPKQQRAAETCKISSNSPMGWAEACNVKNSGDEICEMFMAFNM